MSESKWSFEIPEADEWTFRAETFRSWWFTFIVFAGFIVCCYLSVYLGANYNSPTFMKAAKELDILKKELANEKKRKDIRKKRKEERHGMYASEKQHDY